jgi:PHD/YefM family antitoxin component YafN of YafNO toxin-antitoxin module
MDSLSIQQATENLHTLIDRITANHQPILVQGSHHEAVIVAKEDWAAIEETIYLNAIPGYVEKWLEVVLSLMPTQIYADAVRCQHPR